MPQLPTLMELLQAGAHFGHQRSRWHPKMKPYIFGVRHSVHVIDLAATRAALEPALAFVRGLAAAGKIILFVGSKRQAQDSVRAAAQSCSMPYLVERWMGGLLTNFVEVQRRLKKYHELTALLSGSAAERYTKKEQSVFRKQLAQMERYLGGLAGLERLPDALYLSDVRVEKTAVTEARRMRVPIVGVCDTNVNPEKVDYPIPANDDAVNAITLIVNLVAAAVNEGREEFNRQRAAAAPAAAPAAAGTVAAERPAVRALVKEEA
ncbi:MAG: 30S ribosomal protein S2 [Candidatus Magasanikbacteria bacterium]|nr:30S ribosomal protein S2 [Candidatus Magasanikbacteria bacterium]